MKRIFKILIVDGNNLFSAGLRSYIEEYFSQINRSVFFMSVPHAYPMADLIFWAPNSQQTPLPFGLIRHESYMKKLVMIVSKKDPLLTSYNIPSVFYRHQGREILCELIDRVINDANDPHVKHHRAYGNLKLTTRQEQVLYLLSRGMCLKEISCLLKIDGKTVSSHKRKAMAKLNLPRTTDLYRWLIGNSMEKMAQGPLHTCKRPPLI